MAAYRKFLKKIVPPIFFDLYRFIFSNKNEDSEIFFDGPFSNWEIASLQSSGYDQKEIFEKCKASLLKVKNGEAVYERDSVIFDEIQYSWPALAILQRAALENDGNLCVLDFGGSLGSCYYQNKSFLNGLKKLTWCIVEQPHFVDCGVKYFQDDSLKFFSSMEDAVAFCRPNIIFLSGVLQYIAKPFELIDEIKNFDVNYILLDRTAIIEEIGDILTIQSVPETIYKASYPAWFFNEQKLLCSFHPYKKIAKFDSGHEVPIVLAGHKATWPGYLFSK